MTQRTEESVLALPRPPLPAGVSEAKDVIDRLLAAARLQTAFVDGFRCPDPSGQAVPCTPDGEERAPMLKGPGGMTPCPVSATVGCPQHRAHAAAVHDLEERRWERQAADLGVPLVLWPASFSSEMTTGPLDTAREWMAGGWKQRRALGLFGENGVGKSYAAVAALRMARDGWFVYARDLADQLLSPRHGDESIEKAKMTPLLIIDNLGAEYLKADGALVSKLDSIVWHREGNRRPMIVTSRLPWSTLSVAERRSGARERGESLRGRCTNDMIDRLETWMEMTQFKGPSLRRRG